MTRVSAAWLELREAADAAARAEELAVEVAAELTGTPCVVVHDLGCGTGSMGRWLAPRLPGRQHWIMCDRDPDLLTQASLTQASLTQVGMTTWQTRQCDVTRLAPGDLAGTDLVTGSALLDLLTAQELERIVAACAGAGCTTLLTLSVTGQVQLTPADPLDTAVAAAFNAHQRRTVDGRRLLGPDAVPTAVDAFARHGMVTRVRPSPWRLHPGDAELIAAWFAGWLDAACEHHPDLVRPSRAYARRRLAELAEGRLAVVVHHEDLLARRG